MSKPIAAVVLEGTLTENADADLLNFGDLKPGVKEKLETLHSTHYILIVSAAVKYPGAARSLWLFCIDRGLAFNDIWCGEGLPTVALWVQDDARKL